MKKPAFFLYLVFLVSFVRAQVPIIDSTIEMNLLNAPSNPAFNLMGISTNAIDKPTDLNSFRLSIQNASSGFTKFPSNYAVEFCPASLFDRESQTLSKLNSTKFSDVFWQSFSVSFAYSKSNIDDKETEDSTSFTKMGIGLKVSLLRPRWNPASADKVEALYNLERSVHTAYSNRLAAESSMKAKQLEIDKLRETPSSSERNAKIMELVTQMGTLKKAFEERVNAEIADSAKLKTALATAYTELSKYAAGMKLERIGLFLDFATGIALDFPDDKFDNSLVSKAGAWLTGGYESGNKGLSFLGIGRYLYQPDKRYADDTGKIKTKNISTFDAGARVALNAFQGKFSLNAEAIYRSVLNDNVIKPSWRFTFNAEYSVGINQKITFAFGRNFNGTVTKDGNLIAALNFIKGFGSTKKVAPGN